MAHAPNGYENVAELDSGRGGDAIFVYCLDDGPDGTSSVPVFLTAVTYSVDGWSQPNTDGSTFSTGQSALPSDLSPTAVLTLSHKDNYLYVGPRTGTLADLRLALSDGSSGVYWDGNNDLTNLDVLHLDNQAPFAISPTTPVSSMPSFAPVITESSNPSSSPSSSPVVSGECSRHVDCETDGLGCTVDVCLGDLTCQRTPACPTDYTCVEPICPGGCAGCTEEASCSQSGGCAWSKQDPACIDPPTTCGEINDGATCTAHGCAWSNDPVTCDTKAACNAGSCPGCSWSGKLKSCVDDTDSPCSGGSGGGQCTGADPTPCDRTCNGTQEPFTCQPPPPQCRLAGTSCVDDTDACCGSCSCWTKGKKAGQCT